ncbi:aminoglycoside 3-N-acetyltransferase [Kitasatospora sp. MAP12-15]|uniref:aminoglycoside N(3)-acetyltransferase n=1 Tax=unclassified Kitasatospora TaxID=2633591 RepID=UPI0024746A66|nr:AAC(3) family N-acetyltransferase [Kitasatospora sp. MAP12-44]MDH6112329.1 aminoglycoside 3-N-acetyltransferase [Kitasatospora sp. MAP12-44]
MYSVEQLTGQLGALGLSERTGVVLVHASLRSVGPVAGGSAGLLAALRAALGPAGTVLAYTATPENSETSRLYREATAGLDAAALAAYRAAMPAFDPLRTPCSPTIGRLSEELRTTPGALRSAHPQTSFAALGPLGRTLLADHPLACHLGERSPLGALYRAGGWVLMIGAPLTACTAFHLAEYRAPGVASKRYGCVVRRADGERGWERFEGLDVDDRHFPRMLRTVRPRLGEAGTGRLGDACALLMPMVPAVDAALEWLEARVGARLASPAVALS